MSVRPGPPRSVRPAGRLVVGRVGRVRQPAVVEPSGAGERGRGRAGEPDRRPAARKGRVAGGMLSKFRISRGRRSPLATARATTPRSRPAGRSGAATAPRTACRTAARSGQEACTDRDREPAADSRSIEASDCAAWTGRRRKGSSAPVPSVTCSVAGASAASIVRASMRGLIRDSLTNSEEETSCSAGRPGDQLARVAVGTPLGLAGREKHTNVHAGDPGDRRCYAQFPRGNGRERSGGVTTGTWTSPTSCVTAAPAVI